MGIGFISKEDASYIAGFFDGEGHFSIVQTHRKTRYGETADLNLHIGMSNNSLDILAWIRGVLGIGKITPRTRINNNGYVWYVSKASDMRMFIEMIAPYLKLKMIQAKVASEFLETVSDHYKSSYRLSKETFNKRMELRKEMIRLNGILKF
jgi:predicted transcriptional regulator